MNNTHKRSDSGHHFSVKLSLFMCMLAACSGSPRLHNALHFLVIHSCEVAFTFVFLQYEVNDFGGATAHSIMENGGSWIFHICAEGFQ